MKSLAAETGGTAYSFATWTTFETYRKLEEDLRSQFDRVSDRELEERHGYREVK
jgi:hypothetical protein